MPSKRNLLIATVAVVVLGLLVRANWKLGAGKAGPAGPEPTVRAMPVGRGQLVDRVVAPAALNAARETELRAPFQAPVARLKVQAGDKVPEGAALVVLETTDLENEIRTKEAALIQARQSLTRAEIDARLAPMEAAQRQAAAERAVARAQAALAESRRAAERSGTEADAALAEAEARVAKARAAAVRAAVGSGDLTAARAAAQAAFQALAGAPGDPQKLAAYQQAEKAYQDQTARQAEQAAQLAAEVAAAEKALSAAREQAARAVAEGRVRVENAEVDLAQREYDLEKLRMEQAAGGAGTGLQAAQQAVRAAEDALKALRDKVAEATIKSPLAGVVLEVKIGDGQAVTAGAALVKVGMTETMEVRLRVDESDIAKVQLGQALALRTQAYPGQPFPGKITDVPVAAGQGNQGGGMGPGGGATFLLIGEVQNPDNRLRVGMNAEAEIVTTSRQGVMLIGLEALRTDGPTQAVFVLDGDVARQRPVQTGARSRTQVEVVQGLNDGDKLIFGPFATLKTLKDGQKVKVEGGGGPGGMGGPPGAPSGTFRVEGGGPVRVERAVPGK